MSKSGICRYFQKQVFGDPRDRLKGQLGGMHGVVYRKLFITVNFDSHKVYGQTVDPEEEKKRSQIQYSGVGVHIFGFGRAKDLVFAFSTAWAQPLSPIH